jgi:hypothetical protein
VLIPFPNTPLFKRLDAEGRILTRDWSKYNGKKDVVFQPRLMSPHELLMGWNGPPGSSTHSLQLSSEWRAHEQDCGGTSFATWAITSRCETSATWDSIPKHRQRQGCSRRLDGLGLSPTRLDTPL